MNAVMQALSQLDDWVNPIAVKELRQAVQGRSIPILMLLFIAVELLVIGGVLMFTEGDAGLNQRLGRDVFAWLNPMLAILCIILVPALIGVRLSAERSSGETDLLYITTLTPRQIMWGKFVSAATVNLMLCSVFAPFMTLTYLLRGIDIPSILLALTVTYAASCVAIMTAIFFAAIPGSRGAKSFHGLLLLGVLIFISSSSQGVVQMMINMGLWSMLSRGHAMIPMATTAIAIVVVGGLFFVLATAIISPAHSNRVMPIRIYLTLAWLITAAGVVAIGQTPAMVSSSDELLGVWMIGYAFLFCVTLLGSISENDHISPRIKRSVPRSGLLRLVAFFFFGGAANGVLWSIGMFAATMAGAYLVLAPMLPMSAGVSVYSHIDEPIRYVTVFALYVLCYSFLGLLAKLYLLPKLLANTYTTTIALIVLMLGVLIPPLVHFLMHGTAPGEEQRLWYASNPFALFYYGGQSHSYIETVRPILTMVSAALTLMLVPWMVAQIRRFAPEPISADA